MAAPGVEDEFVIGVVDCPRLVLYSSFLTRKGYKLTQKPGSACAVLLACEDHLAEKPITAWGRAIAGPKLVLDGNPPPDWSDAERVALPLLPLNLEQRILATRAAKEPPAARSRRYDVVVVDDDATIRAAAAQTLRTLGLDVRGCGGFADLTGALLLARPDFIVLDLNLPGISGESLGNIIRARKIPTALLSSAPLHEIREVQEKIGGITAFSKSVSLASMGRWIREYLDRRSA
jgi:CheY-like chemotaxis protein